MTLGTDGKIKTKFLKDYGTSDAKVANLDDKLVDYPVISLTENLYLIWIIFILEAQCPYIKFYMTIFLLI
nr:hypothetical protein [uncultured Treponema sp.]